jgi:hypothetical protein
MFAQLIKRQARQGPAATAPAIVATARSLLRLYANAANETIRGTDKEPGILPEHDVVPAVSFYQTFEYLKKNRNRRMRPACLMTPSASSHTT